MGLYGPTNQAFNEMINVPANVSFTDLYQYLYTDEGQQISIGNFWNDPYRKSISKYYIFLHSD